MRTLSFIIQKEFIQIFRNKPMLFMMTVLPIVQLIVLASAASNEVKDVRVVIVDLDYSESSRDLVRRIKYNDRFIIAAYSKSKAEAKRIMQQDETDLILEIPADFEQQFLRKEKPELQVLANSINGQQATLGTGYLRSIIGLFNADLVEDVLPGTASGTGSTLMSVRNWYNPELSYSDFMVPGILAELAALLTIVLTAMNVVREREIGTIEQINVTPIKKWELITGKLIPFLCVGLVLLSVGLLVGRLVFQIQYQGSLLLMFGYAVLNLIAVLGLGLLISNFADTQQQAIFVAFFFVLVFILMCGLFTPIESMPKWAQYFTIPNPLAHIISVSRKILMKGSGLSDIRMEITYTIGLAVVFNSLAIYTYKKQT